MKFSKSTSGFYPDSGYAGTLPADAIDISDTTYAALLLANARGATIQAASDGTPQAVTPSGAIVDLSTVTAESNFSSK